MKGKRVRKNNNNNNNNNNKHLNLGSFSRFYILPLKGTASFLAAYYPVWAVGMSRNVLFTSLSRFLRRFHTNPVTTPINTATKVHDTATIVV